MPRPYNLSPEGLAARIREIVTRGAMFHKRIFASMPSQPFPKHRICSPRLNLLPLDKRYILCVGSLSRCVSNSRTVPVNPAN